MRREREEIGGAVIGLDKVRLLLGAAAAVVVLALAAGCAGEKEEGTPIGTPAAQVDGVTDTEIILGTHFALTGTYGAVYSPLIKATEAYFRYANDHGGVCNRSIVLKVEDDGYDPARAAEVIRKLVERDKVFAIIGGLGTAAHSAVWEYLNEKGVPDLFIMSGAHKWGADPQKYPWSVGFIMDYTVEGTVLGKYISADLPGKKVGILYQNDDFGKDGLAGVKAGLDPSKNEIVSEQAYEPTATSISSQLINLRNAGTEVLVGYSLPPFTAQAITGADRMGWKPQFVISYVNADPIMFQFAPPQLMEGVVSVQASKMYDWLDDPAVARHHQIMMDYGGPNPSTFTIGGQALAELTIGVLSRACDNLTRRGLMDAVESLDHFAGDLALPGITVTLSKTDHYTLQTMKMLRVVNGKWEYFGDLISVGE